MRVIGFSTGALSKGDVAHGAQLQASASVSAIEVSALREHELGAAVAALGRLDVSQYHYISMHVPSELHSMSEAELVRQLLSVAAPAAFVVHPNIIKDRDAWHPLAERMCIENMDQRKPVGRTTRELRPFMNEFSRAGFCLDLGHAHQIDPTMGVAMELLDAFGSRLRHLHVSEVNPHGRHMPIGYTARHAFQRIAGLIPLDVPIIIESIIGVDSIAEEVRIVAEIFGQAVLRKVS